MEEFTKVTLIKELQMQCDGYTAVKGHFRFSLIALKANHGNCRLQAFISKTLSLSGLSYGSYIVRFLEHKKKGGVG